MTTSGKIFVDTNILLRATHINAPLHREADRLLKRMRDARYELWISRQVIREYLVQITRPGFLAASVPVEQAVEHMRTIQSLFAVADETAQVTQILLELILEAPTAGKQVHDANIIATMLANGIDTIVTQNVDDMKRFAHRVKIVSLVEETE